MRRAAAAMGVGAAAGALAGLLFTFASGAMSLAVAAVCRGVERWRTWQGASVEQRQRIRQENKRLGDRFDWLRDNEVGTEVNDQLPQKGDKVRVTYEAAWLGGHPEGGDAVAVKGETLRIPFTANVEVLEPADDPSKSLIGETRQSAAGVVVAKPYGAIGWKVIWDCGATDRDYYADEHVVGWPVIGTVPGTPAARQVPLLSDAWQRRKPRVFSSDGPEPPEDVRVLIDLKPDPEESSFAYLVRTWEGWQWSPSPELIEPDYGPPGQWAERAPAACGDGFREVPDA